MSQSSDNQMGFSRYYYTKSSGFVLIDVVVVVAVPSLYRTLRMVGKGFFVDLWSLAVLWIGPSSNKPSPKGIYGRI